MDLEPLRGGALDEALALNNAHPREVSVVSAGELAGLVDQAHLSGWAPDRSGFVIAMDRGSSYGSPNYRYFVDRWTEPLMYVDRIVVAPGHRGRGVGRALYLEVIAAARRLGARWVCCEVNLEPLNEVSLGFHHALGFTRVGEAELGPGKRVAYLALELPSARAVPPLRPGATVAVVAPAGPFDLASFERGVEVVRRRYAVDVGPHLFAARRYLAGTDEERLADLQSALDAPGVQAVLAARGGYGSSRIAPRVAPRARALAGFSDITALLLRLFSAGLRSVHGPVVTQLGRLDAVDVERLWAALEGRALEPLEGTVTVVPGRARGPLVGGNLSLLAHLVGTGLLPPLHGCVLLVEDVGERPYRLDRLWTQLELAGVLRTVSGVVVGELTGCEEKDAGYSAVEVLGGLAAALGVPCAAGFPVGHGERNAAVPVGAMVELDAAARTLTFLEGATG